MELILGILSSQKTAADDFVIGDLRSREMCRYVVDRPFDEVYQLAADMGAPVLFSPVIMTAISCTIPHLST